MTHGPSIGCLLAVMLGLGPVATTSAQGLIKLPIVVGLTGPGAPGGAMWRDGVSLAVEDINRTRGILGLRLETSLHDTQTDPGKAAAVMLQVLDDKPFAVFGPVDTPSTVATTDLTRNAGILHFTGSDSVIITQKGNDNIFMTSFAEDVAMAAFVRWLVEDLKAEKVAVVWVNDAFGKGGRDMFLQSMTTRGQTPVADLSIEVQQADFTPELTKVRAAGATHVMVYGHPEESARFMTEHRKMGLPAQPVGETTLCMQTTITLGGAAVNGARCHVGLVAAPAMMPQVMDMSRRFEVKYGRMPDDNALKGYIGVHMLKAAVQRARKWDPAQVRGCLHHNLFTTLQEPGILLDLYVNDKGGLDRPSFIVEVKEEKPVVTRVVGMVGSQQYVARSCR